MNGKIKELKKQLDTPIYMYGSLFDVSKSELIGIVGDLAKHVEQLQQDTDLKDTVIDKMDARLVINGREIIKLIEEKAELEFKIQQYEEAIEDKKVCGKCNGIVREVLREGEHER
jgi:hypothetical protein